MDPAEQTMAREQQFQFNTSDVSVILGFFLDVMLYQPLTARDLQEGNLKQPGLSKQAMEDVTNKGKVEWTMTKLKDAKLGIIHFVLTPIFTDSERLPLLIAGVCDSNQQVASTCEDGMRKWIGSVDYEDKKTIQTLYRLYLGTKDEKDPRLQASTPIKIRVLQYLTKSVAAANMNTHMIQVVFDGIYGETTTPKLQRFTFAFLQWCARMVSDFLIKKKGMETYICT